MREGGLDAFFQRMAYGGEAQWASVVLLPLSWLYGAVVRARRAAYRLGLLPSQRVAAPVIVVGNITVGGVGKTPFTIWLASQLAARGLCVGVVLRGYGGRAREWPYDVTSATAPEEAGDEAVLLASRTDAIVVAAPDRVAAARRAVDRGAQVVLADDGLQHYRLARDVEIVVIDEQRELGNGRLLPAGPLREPRSRLDSVDLIVRTRRGEVSGDKGGVTVTAQVRDAISLATGEVRPLDAFKGRTVHALAAIGNPGAFFDSLRAAGLSVSAHPLPDHATLTADTVRFGDDAPVLMTEKDAVKCRAFADRRLWAIRLELDMTADSRARVHALIDRALATHRISH